jgi:hypothetical protein
MSDFNLHGHQLVFQLLEALNGDFLSSVDCFFGGGTRIVLELSEYRESMDVDFLCSSRDGYRRLRNTITQQSLGELVTGDVPLMREVRADMYGIRTYFELDNQPIKFEIIFEGRISLTGKAIDKLPVMVLEPVSCFAEKFLANTDRGRDVSTRSRDLIDLAFMAASWQPESLRTGFDQAESAYGESVRRELEHTLNMFGNSKYRTNCVRELSVTDTRRLNKGIDLIRAFIK